MTPSRPRVLVCGTKFGRAYLGAFSRPDHPFELAGILARGSARSEACAAHHGVPLYTSLDEVPEVDMACVVIGTAVNGGRGAVIAQDLLRRGVHVLQEHPLHQDELAECLRVARRHGAVYRLNTHYVHVAPVRRFVAAARALREHQPVLFVDAQCAFQVAYTLFDILAAALGSVRPWALAPPADLPPQALRHGGEALPYRSLDGVVGGVPCTLRVQNELVPAEPDNYSHLFHRVTVGFEGGHLTLVNTHGPVLWSPRPHMPPGMDGLARFEESDAGHLDHPSGLPLGEARAPSYREILATLWPEATAAAMGELWEAVRVGDAGAAHGQHHLTLTRLASEVAELLGPVRLLRREPPDIEGAQRLVAGVLEQVPTRQGEPA